LCPRHVEIERDPSATWGGREATGRHFGFTYIAKGPSLKLDDHSHGRCPVMA
jgi:hypothetical protein